MLGSREDICAYDISLVPFEDLKTMVQKPEMRGYGFSAEYREIFTLDRLGCRGKTLLKTYCDFMIKTRCRDFSCLEIAEDPDPEDGLYNDPEGGVVTTGQIMPLVRYMVAPIAFLWRCEHPEDISNVQLEIESGVCFNEK